MATLVPIYRHHASDPGRYYYDTKHPGQNGWSDGVIAFYAYASHMEHTVPIYGHYDSSPPRFFYDTRSAAHDGWGAGEVEFYAHTEPLPGTIPVYAHYVIDEGRGEWIFYYDTHLDNDYGWSKGEIAFYAYAHSTDDVSQWWCQCLSWEYEDSLRKSSKKRAAFLQGILWKYGSEITYAIKAIDSRRDPYFEGSEEREGIIDAAFHEWNSVNMGISFKKIDDYNAANIRITRDPSRSDYSQMGKDALKFAAPLPTMNLGMRKGLGAVGHTTALHEIGHAVGLVHEHQRPDSPIVWNREGVYEFFKNRKPVPVTDRGDIDKAVFENSDVLEPVTGGGSQFPYDQFSVMNYDFPAECFLVPAALKQHGIIRSQHLTETDKQTARYFYNQLKEETGL